MNEKFFDLNKTKQDCMINAALKVFAENSYRHASTDTIVKNAGISKGLLFHYFESKTGLYTFLFDYSVKYMIFELDHTVSKDSDDYFLIRKDMEKAKLNVLRNYPYMSQFIKSGLYEDTIDVIEKIEEPKKLYLETIASYTANAKMGTLSAAVTEKQVETLIRYAVEGLTGDQLKADCFQPELLYREICSYIDMIHSLTVIGKN